MSDLQVEDEAGEEWEERASLLHFGISEGSEGEGKWPERRWNRWRMRDGARLRLTCHEKFDESEGGLLCWLEEDERWARS